jgi:hypothetical protein
MSAKRTRASDGVHPLAQPFLFLFKPGMGRLIVIVLAVLLLVSFGLELALSGDKVWSKYPEVLGAYEWMPLVAATGAILAAWLLRRVLSARPGFYERAAGAETTSDDGEAR